MSSISQERKNIRIDIQALRGWAVLVVVIDHARLGFLHSGFLGVDIFFVISGFLITGIICRFIDVGKFQFGDFYLRRARRILPAAFVTILTTAFLSIFSSTSTEIPSLLNQIYGALTYTINFVLWFQVDYFDVGANLKPLLHMWSLSVEEQFYIFLPILLFVIPSIFRIATITVISILSFLFCLYWVRSDPAGAFYLLPTRAWELGIGAVLAVAITRFSGVQRLANALYYPALLALVIIPFLPFEYTHPGFVAFAICFAAAMFIGAEKEFDIYGLPGKALAKIGDISYSLYLVHWPIMVFFYSGYLGETPKFLALITIPLSLLTAFAMYRYVEQPGIRAFPKPEWKHLLIVPTVTALVGAASVGFVTLSKPGDEFAKLREPNYGLDKTCDYSGKTFQPRPECRNGNNPTVFVWGDSYAMHLVPGLSEKVTLEQATFSACPTFLGFSPKRKNFNKADVWADLCLKFNTDVLEYLKSREDIRTVVLGSPWRLFVKEGGVVWSKEEGSFVEHATGLDFAIKEMANTVAQIRQMGKEVLLFGPPPASGGDTSGCLERIVTGKVVFGSDCEIAAGRALRYDAVIREFLEAVSKSDGVRAINLSDIMCDTEVCITQSQGVPIYRDKGHLSVEGSKIVFDRIDLKFRQ